MTDPRVAIVNQWFEHEPDAVDLLAELDAHTRARLESDEMVERVAETLRRNCAILPPEFSRMLARAAINVILGGEVTTSAFDEIREWLNDTTAQGPYQLYPKHAYKLIEELEAGFTRGEQSGLERAIEALRERLEVRERTQAVRILESLRSASGEALIKAVKAKRETG